MKGDIIVAKYPFTDLKTLKKRPAVVIAQLDFFDPIVCPITSSFRSDKYAITLSEADLEEGYLKYDSLIRPTNLFTLDKSLIVRKIGCLTETKVKELEAKLVAIISA